MASLVRRRCPGGSHPPPAHWQPWPPSPAPIPPRCGRLVGSSAVVAAAAVVVAVAATAAASPAATATDTRAVAAGPATATPLVLPVDLPDTPFARQDWSWLPPSLFWLAPSAVPAGGGAPPPPAATAIYRFT